MKVVIDTCSLLSLVRYYLPFDKNNVLYNFMEEKIENKEFIILDKVFEECKYTAKGIVAEKLKYLSNKKNLVKTDELFPSKKFFNQLDNQFINHSAKNKLDSVEYENRRAEYLNLADVKLLLYGLKVKQNELAQCSIVTEETEKANDNKFFKKIPAICKILDLNVLTLPQLFAKSDGIEIKISTL